MKHPWLTEWRKHEQAASTWRQFQWILTLFWTSKLQNICHSANIWCNTSITMHFFMSGCLDIDVPDSIRQCNPHQRVKYPHAIWKAWSSILPQAPSSYHGQNNDTVSWHCQVHLEPNMLEIPTALLLGRYADIMWLRLERHWLTWIHSKCTHAQTHTRCILFCRMQLPIDRCTAFLCTSSGMLCYGRNDMNKLSSVRAMSKTCPDSSCIIMHPIIEPESEILCFLQKKGRFSGSA